MKKVLLLVFAFALILSLSLTGCGEKDSGTMEIDSETLGGITEVAVGDLGKYDLSDEMFGTYSVAIPPEYMVKDDCSIEFYASENDSMVQFISVHRWKTAEPLEEDENSDENYTSGDFISTHNDVMDLDCTMNYGTYEIEGQNYYTQTYVFVDGDYTVQLRFYGTESFEK